MMNIVRQMVSADVVKSRSYGKGNKCTHIVIHETDNYNESSGAKNHANLQSNKNPREASWQYQVDDKEIIQSFEDDVKCWAVGKGNDRSINIEMCVNDGSDFNKTIHNTIFLVKHLMKKHDISIKNVVQHNYWTGKECPKKLRSGIPVSWSGFIKMVQDVKVDVIKPDVKPSKGELYQVIAGTYSDKVNADKMSQQLKKYGIDNYIVKK